MLQNKILLIPVILFTFLQACTSKPKFKAGDCVLPPDGSREKMLKISAVSSDEYKVFTYSLSSGKLVQSQNEMSKTRSELEGDFFVIDCPSPAN